MKIGTSGISKIYLINTNQLTPMKTKEEIENSIEYHKGLLAALNDSIESRRNTIATNESKIK